MRQRQGSARDIGILLKGKHTKSHLQPLTLGSCGVRQRRLESWKERLWFVNSGERAEGHPLRPLCLVTLPHYNAIFLEWRTPLHMASSWGNAVALPSSFPVVPTWGGCTVLNWLPGLGCRGLGRLRGCHCLSCVALGQGTIPPTLLWTRLGPLPHKRTISLILWAPGDATVQTPGGSAEVWAEFGTDWIVWLWSGSYTASITSTSTLWEIHEPHPHDSRKFYPAPSLPGRI